MSDKAGKRSRAAQRYADVPAPAKPPGKQTRVARRYGTSSAPVVQRKATGDKGGKDDKWSWEQDVLDKLKRNKLQAMDAHYLTDALKKLSGAGDAAGKRLLAQLQKTAKRKNFYFQGGFGSAIWGIYRGQSTIKALKSGTDNPHHIAGLQHALVEASTALKKPAKYANDKRLTDLLHNVSKAWRFANNVTTWGKNINKHHGYVRQLKTMAQAGTVLDHHMLFTLRAPDGVNMWRENVLTTHLGDPLVGNSATFKEFKTCYARFLALEQALKSDQGDGYEKSGRGHTKAQLMAMKEKVPEYTVADGPKDEKAGSYSSTERDFQDIEKRAKELLKQKAPVPGDLYTTKLRLKSIRSHLHSIFQRSLDKLVLQIDAKFAQSKDPAYIQKDKSQGVAIEFDLDKGITIGHLRSALNTIANEPGEMGQLSFKLTVRGSYGNRVIRGFVEGWAHLRLFYGVGDAMSCYMGFDLSAAFAAGISLAGGLVEGKVEAGAGFGMKAKFANPGQAATWLWHELKRVNDDADKKTGGRYRPFTIIGAGKAKKPKPTVVKEKRMFMAAEGGVDAGVAGGGARISKTQQSNEYRKNGKTVTGRYDEVQKSYTAFIKVGDLLINVGYTKTDSTTKNDANTTNDGIDQNHAFTLEFDVTKIIKQVRSGTIDIPKHLPRKKVFEIVAKGLSKFATYLPGGKISSTLIDSLVGGVAEKVFEVISHGRKYKLGASITMDIEWNMAKEKGQWRQEYVRAGVTPKFKAGLEVDAKAINVKAEFEAHKREVVFEKVGTNTSGYVFQRYVFAWDKQQWKDFVNTNKDEVAKLMTNMANYRTNAYDKEFATKVKKVAGRGFQGKLNVLEAHWDTKRGDTVHKKLQ